jgi:GLPGLI family protein
MKKIAIITSLAAIGFAFTAFTAPKTSEDPTFEGVVTYSMNVDNPQAAAMMQGSSVKEYIKGNMNKTCVDAGPSKQTYITDRTKTDSPIILIEIMGNKYQVKTDKTKKEDKDPVIKYTDETKQVAGYTCHKAEITTTDEQGQASATNVYYTEDIKVTPSKNGQFKGLKGFPLEYSMKQQGMNITISATKVEKEAISDDTFAVPAGYKLMTKEEMMQDVQKNMSSGN